MKYSSTQITAIAVFIFGNIGLYIVYINLEDNLRNLINLLSLFGTFLSLFGIGLAYLQIKNLKETSEQTNKAVTQSLSRINQILSVSELSRANKIIQEIQTSIHHQKHDVCLLRMRDLKQILSQVKYNSDLNEFTNIPAYTNNITDLTIDINNVNDLVLGIKRNVSFSKINQNLENLATILTDFENKLKYKNDAI